MGPVNWLAVVMAAAFALGIMTMWNGRFGTTRASLGGAVRTPGKFWLVGLVLLLAAVMLGHNFARIGAVTLNARPWLYFMQTGGVALFFVIPAVWLSHVRVGTEPKRRLLDSCCWLAAYLAMGVVFWLLG
jgi:hypothetical protein